MSTPEQDCLLYDGGGGRRETADRSGGGFQTNVIMAVVNEWFHRGQGAGGGVQYVCIITRGSLWSNLV